MAQAFEDADDCLARLREERVAEAGDEEGDAQSGESNPAIDSDPMTPDALARFAAATEVIREPEQLRTYECDGLTGHRVVPALVALPGTVAEVQAVVRICNEERLPFVARGAGTGLSGGALPVAEGIVISLARMTRILEIDIERGQVVVEPGVTNLDVTRAVAGEGFYYAPDPSSQQVCTIGGNVAENSGGAHCLKYGFTSTTCSRPRSCLPDGELVELSVWDDGPDLLGVFVGSEGTLGIATKVTLRILRAPEAVRTLLAGFAHTDDAGGAVSAVIAAGILPAAIEMMDAVTIEAAEAAVNANYPDGLRRRADRRARRPGRAGRGGSRARRGDLPGAPRARDPHRVRSRPIARRSGAVARRRSRRWVASARTTTCRTASFRARCCPRCCGGSTSSSQEHGLRVGNVFHAGDGNLHPLVLYDGRVEGEAARAEELSQKILVACIDAGGSITGEHGVGTDKACAMPLMFGEDDIAAMQRLRRAFDPHGLANPGKLFPTPRLCGEVPGPYRAHPLEKAGLADRF